MTYSELYKFTLNELKDISDSPSTEAGMLFQHCFGFDRIKISVNGDKTADEESERLLYECLKKRREFIPIQYILGKGSFYDNDFIVGDGVLIPRPETEILVEQTLEFTKQSGVQNPVIFDLCSGSGCVGISIAKCLPDAIVYLFEKSDKAIGYIKKNIELNQTNNVTVIEYDIFDGIPDSLPTPDILVSNPPYIPKADIDALQPEVKKEPVMALDGGDDGLDFYHCICDKWLSYVDKSVFYALEFGIYQSDDILKIFERVSYDAQITKDFNGIDRVVYGKTMR